VKTIKELADEIGVSKTAIFKKLTPELRAEYTETVSGVIKVSSEGENLIRQGFKRKNEPQTNQDNLQTTDNDEDFERYACSKETFDMFKTVLEALQKQLTVKDEQLAAKDKQLAEKDKQLALKDTQLEIAQTVSVSTIKKHLDVGLARIEALATNRNFFSRFTNKQCRAKLEPETKTNLLSRIFGRQRYREGQQYT